MVPCIHLGAHKTASTHLQNALHAARQVLMTHRVAYFGPRVLRHRLGLQPVMPPVAAMDPELLAQLHRHNGAGRRLVLSEENILGTTRPRLIARGAQLYPDAEARLGAVLSALGAHHVTLFVAVRMPLDFLVSAYGQQIYAGQVKPFAQYVAGIEPAALRWSDLVGRLRRLPGVAHCVVWQFEQYPGIAATVLDQMLGSAATCVTLPERQSNPGISAAALAEVLTRGQAMAPAEARKLVRARRAALPKSADRPGFAPFGQAERARALSDYCADLDRLAAQDGVTLLAGVPADRT